MIIEFRNSTDKYLGKEIFKYFPLLIVKNKPMQSQYESLPVGV